MTLGMRNGHLFSALMMLAATGGAMGLSDTGYGDEELTLGNRPKTPEEREAERRERDEAIAKRRAYTESVLAREKAAYDAAAQPHRDDRAARKAAAFAKRQPKAKAKTEADLVKIDFAEVEARIAAVAAFSSPDLSV